MERPCDSCGDPYEAKTKRSKFCSTACRVSSHNAKPGGAAAPAAAPRLEAPTKPKTDVTDRLMQDLERLGVQDRYEAGIAIGIARQLDSGVVQGTAYVSLSKEIDRRVDALRMAAERPDDPVRKLLTAVEDKQAHLRLA